MFSVNVELTYHAPWKCEHSGDIQTNWQQKSCKNTKTEFLNQETRATGGLN